MVVALCGVAAILPILIPVAQAADPCWKAFVRVTTAYRTGQVKLWTSDDGQSWTYVSSSEPYLSTETNEAAHVPYTFALEYLPAYVRIGVTGPFLGRTSIDSIETRVGNKVRTPKSMEPVGEVIDPGNASLADGKHAIIVHRGQTNEINGFVARFRPTRKPPSHRADKVRFGNYTSPAEAGDRRAEAIAPWDFTVFQEGANLEACVRKVKQRNPNHRIVLRLVYPTQSMLLYAYDADARSAIQRMVLGQFSGFADLVDTVTLNEEEPGNMMRGIYGSSIPPESLYVWRHKFERETGKTFTWPAGDEAFNNWLGQKFQFMLNDLYDTIKRQYPKISVYQWVELRGYGNISGYPEYVIGESLKMDGYVLEWGDVYIEALVDTPQGKASVRNSYFGRYLSNLMARNHLKPTQVLGQVWAFDPSTSDVLEQIENERKLGIADIYFFWPNAATPGVFDLFGETNTPDWNVARDAWGRFKPLLEAEQRKR